MVMKRDKKRQYEVEWEGKKEGERGRQEIDAVQKKSAAVSNDFTHLVSGRQGILLVRTVRTWEQWKAMWMLFLSMTLHGLVWNTIHPAMHGLPDVPLAIGYPSSTLKFLNGSPAFEYLRLNHIGHHVASGRSNYNVCCPGMDYVVGKKHIYYDLNCQHDIDFYVVTM